MKQLAILGMASMVLVHSALAHRLSVEWSVVDGRLAVTAQLEGAPAAGADVAIASDAGVVLADGRLDSAGRFLAPLPADGGLTVTVNAGLGHRRSLRIAAGELNAARRPAPIGAATGAGEAGTEIQPGSEIGAGGVARGDSEGSLVARVVVGLACVLSLAAAWMSFRNHRRLAALERERLSDARRG